MKRVTLAAMTCAVLAGCVTFPHSANELMNAPLGKAHEFKAEVPVPLTTAYKNVLAKARECWQRENRIVELEPFTQEDGFARITLRIVAGLTHDSVVPAVVELFPETKNTSRLIARSMYAGYATPPGAADLPNLTLWAAGKEVDCQ